MRADVACPLLALTPLPTNTHFNRVLDINLLSRRATTFIALRRTRAHFQLFLSFSKSVKLLIRALKRGLSSPEL